MATVPVKLKDMISDPVEIVPLCAATLPEPPKANTGPKLRPLPPDPDREPEDCPRCAAAVLATDTACANCGLERANEAPIADACDTVPAMPCARNAGESVENIGGDGAPLVAICANSPVVLCARNVCQCVESTVGSTISEVVKTSPICLRKNARSRSVPPRQRPEKLVVKTRRNGPARASSATATKRGASAAAVAGPREPTNNSTLYPAVGATWRWHGGTFAPPPYLLQESLAQSTAEPKAEPTAQPAGANNARPGARARRKASPGPEPSTPSGGQAAKPPEDPGPKAQEPSAAALRLMALQARIRAKEAAGR